MGKGPSCGFRGKERAKQDKQAADWFAMFGSGALLKFMVSVTIRTHGLGLSEVSGRSGGGPGIITWDQLVAVFVDVTAWNHRRYKFGFIVESEVTQERWACSGHQVDKVAELPSSL